MADNSHSTNIKEKQDKQRWLVSQCSNKMLNEILPKKHFVSA
jgi:hypothetical protein